MYNLTLELLNKFKTSSVTPDEWVIIANTVQIEHVLFLYEKYKKDQAVYDKLQPIIEKVELSNGGGTVAGQELFALPYATVPGASTKYSYGYLRALSVSFKLFYKNDACFADGEGTRFEPAKVLDEDIESVAQRNPYRRPKSNRIYYKAINNVITVETGSDTYATTAKVIYIRYPRAIDLNQSPGIGDCELPIDVRNDICHLIAQKYIEQKESGRYATISNEINKQINS